MRLTTKGRYAVTAMLDLAIHFDKGSVTLADISRRQGISLSYLEQLFAKLRKKGLVDSTRGPGGGYRLSQPPSEIPVLDVIVAVDEKVDATACDGEGNCQDHARCLTHELWMDLSRQLYSFLENINLGKLMEQRDVQEIYQRQDQDWVCLNKRTI